MRYSLDLSPSTVVLERGLCFAPFVVFNVHTVILLIFHLFVVQLSKSYAVTRVYFTLRDKRLAAFPIVSPWKATLVSVVVPITSRNGNDDKYLDSTYTEFTLF